MHTHMRAHAFSCILYMSVLSMGVVVGYLYLYACLLPISNSTSIFLETNSDLSIRSKGKWDIERERKGVSLSTGERI